MGDTLAILPYTLVGLAVRVILEPRVGFLKHYPYFNTPLIDIRQLFETFNNYELTKANEFSVPSRTPYFIDKNAINQPLAIVQLYHFLYTFAGNNVIGIKAFLFFYDFLTVLFQCLIIAHIYKKEKDSKVKRIVQLILIFNPLSVISPAVHNLAILNHLLISAGILSILKLGFNKVTDLIWGVALYVDPTLLYVLVPVRLIHGMVY